MHAVRPTSPGFPDRDLPPRLSSEPFESAAARSRTATHPPRMQSDHSLRCSNQKIFLLAQAYSLARDAKKSASILEVPPGQKSSSPFRALPSETQDFSPAPSTCRDPAFLHEGQTVPAEVQE